MFTENFVIPPNFAVFKEQWKDNMVYKPSEFDVEQTLNDYYTEYKSDPYFSKMSVKEFCETYFVDFNFNDHPYMIKSKAINSSWGDGLRKLAGAKVWKWEDIQKEKQRQASFPVEDWEKKGCMPPEPNTGNY